MQHVTKVIQNGSKITACELPCRRWRCKRCCKTMKAKRVRHFSSCFRTCTHVYKSTIDRREWDAAYKRLHRRHADYVTVLKLTRLVIYSTHPLNSHSEKLTPKEASRLFARDVKYIYAPIPGIWRPINSSRSWKLPTRIPTSNVIKTRYSLKQFYSVASMLKVPLRALVKPDFRGLQADFSLLRVRLEATFKALLHAPDGHSQPPSNVSPVFLRQTLPQASFDPFKGRRIYRDWRHPPPI